jgi:hypothetical protein
VPWLQQLVGAGIAFFSYDKRGAGESEGVCCLGDESHFNLLAADADRGGERPAQASGDRARPDRVSRHEPGRLGVPLAVVRPQEHVAFSALADGPAVTTHEEEQRTRAVQSPALNLAYPRPRLHLRATPRRRRATEPAADQHDSCQRGDEGDHERRPESDRMEHGRHRGRQGHRT